MFGRFPTLMCRNVLPAKISRPPNVQAPSPLINYFLSSETLKSRRSSIRHRETKTLKHDDSNESYHSTSQKEIPRHFGIFQRKKAEFYTLEIHARPEKGFYLSFSHLPKENCVEMHLKPQVGAFAAPTLTGGGKNFHIDDYVVDTQNTHISDSKKRLEGQAMFDNRNGIYKRFYVDSLGDMLAVLEHKLLIHERFSVDGDRRLGFRKTKNGNFKLYVCGNQFRLPGCPKIEATLTLGGEDVTQLKCFFEYSLRFCINNNINSSNRTFSQSFSATRNQGTLKKVKKRPGLM